MIDGDLAIIIIVLLSPFFSIWWLIFGIPICYHRVLRRLSGSEARGMTDFEYNHWYGRVTRFFSLEYEPLKGTAEMLRQRALDVEEDEAEYRAQYLDLQTEYDAQIARNKPLALLLGLLVWIGYSLIACVVLAILIFSFYRLLFC